MAQDINKKDYQDMVTRKSPESKTVKNCIKAFLIGGTICTVGQCFLSTFKALGMTVEHASTLTSIVMIFIGVLLTGLDVYPKIAKHGGAGTLVPITGFANAVSAPAIEAKTEGFILGVGAKIFTIAGPVILYGTVASFVAGIVFYFMQ